MAPYSMFFFYRNRNILRLEIKKNKIKTVNKKQGEKHPIWLNYLELKTIKF